MKRIICLHCATAPGVAALSLWDVMHRCHWALNHTHLLLQQIGVDVPTHRPRLLVTCPLAEHVRSNPKGGDLCPDRLHRGENLVKGCIGANVQIVPSDLGIGVQGPSNHLVAGSCRNVPQDSQRQYELINDMARPWYAGPKCMPLSGARDCTKIATKERMRISRVNDWR